MQHNLLAHMYLCLQIVATEHHVYLEQTVREDDRRAVLQ